MNRESVLLIYSPRTLIPFNLIQLPSRAAKEVVQGQRRAWPEEATPGSCPCQEKGTVTTSLRPGQRPEVRSSEAEKGDLTRSPGRRPIGSERTGVKGGREAV